MRRVIILFTALIVAGIAASAGARTLDEIISDGTIRIGVNPNFPPMSSFGLTNQLEGFDIDIGNRIAEAIGVDAEFVTTETAQRVPFLVSNRIDIALGALTRHPSGPSSSAIPFPCIPNPWASSPRTRSISRTGGNSTRRTSRWST